MLSRITVNGEPVEREIDPRRSLSDFLREDLGLTGTHVGCEHGVCGACTVLVDGQSARACLLLAVQCEGASVTTIEGLTPAEGLLPYLPGDAQLRLLESVTELSAPGSRLAVEEFRGTRKIAADPQISSFGAKQGMDLDAVLHDDGELPVAEILARLNWGSEIEFSEDAAARFGRNPGPGAAPMLDVSQFVMAVKRG